VQTEYRWEAWVGLDMALFFDAGQVFADRSELSLENLQTSYGIGFRFKMQESMLLRFDLGYGSEGLKPDLSLNRIF
jgi:hemolysin activation/secretion protein